MKKLFGILFMASLLVSGCGNGGSGGGSGASSLTVTGASGNKVGLNGSWSEGCSEGLGQSDKFTTTFSGSSLTGEGDSWASVTDCSGPSDMTMSLSGTITLGEDMSVAFNASSVTARKVDGTVTSALMTANNAVMAATFNATSFCGATDWVAGKAKDVLGTACMENFFRDIIFIDDTADPDLFYGGLEQADGGTLDANGYPTEIDTSAPEKRL